jgi:2'-5' RNA ligase
MAAPATERDPRRAQLRLFFALWPDPAAAAALWRAAQALRKHCGGRSVPRDNLHLTLVFLGAVGPERAAVLAPPAAAAAGAAAPFELSLDRAGCWHRQGLVWAGTGAAPAALSLLAARLGEALRGSGFAIERRRFKPHVTLLRDVARPPAPAAFAPVAWTAREFVLAASETGPRGPRYRAIGRWPLAGGL